MCSSDLWSIDDCKDCGAERLCPLAYNGVFLETKEEAEAFEKVVDEWRKNENTYLHDFKRRFPKTNYDDSMITRLCVAHLYGIKCPEIVCKDCWNSPVEE